MDQPGLGLGAGNTTVSKKSLVSALTASTNRPGGQTIKELLMFAQKREPNCKQTKKRCTTSLIIKERRFSAQWDTLSFHIVLATILKSDHSKLWEEAEQQEPSYTVYGYKLKQPL